MIYIYGVSGSHCPTLRTRCKWLYILQSRCNKCPHFSHEETEFKEIMGPIIEVIKFGVGM